MGAASITCVGDCVWGDGRWSNERTTTEHSNTERHDAADWRRCALPPGFILKAKNPLSHAPPLLLPSPVRLRARARCLITAARLVRHPHRQHSMSFPHQKLPRLSGIYGPQSMHLSIHASHLAASAADTLPLASAALPPQVSPDGANVGDRSRARVLYGDGAVRRLCEPRQLCDAQRRDQGSGRLGVRCHFR